MNKMTEKQRAMQRREDSMMRKIRRKAREVYDLPTLPRIVMSDLNRIWQDQLRTPLGILGTKYMTEGLLDVLKERGLEIVKKDETPTSDEMQIIQQALMQAEMTCDLAGDSTTLAGIQKAIGITLKYTQS